jgi:hypothetical protein
MSPSDWCTAEGADRLKKRILEYWSERGYAVDVKLVDAGFMPAMRSARCDVRSDMVNGMPRRIERKGDDIVVRRPVNSDTDNNSSF